MGEERVDPKSREPLERGKPVLQDLEVDSKDAEGGRSNLPGAFADDANVFFKSELPETFADDANVFYKTGADTDSL